MLNKNDKDKQKQVQFVALDDLVPNNHLLRKIDTYIDFDFIYDLVEDKYCLDNGRPSIDPVVLMKVSIHTISLRHKKYASDNKRSRSKPSIQMVLRTRFL